MVKMEKVERNNIFKNLFDLVNIPSYGTIDNNHPIINYFRDKLKDCEIVENIDSNGNTHLLVGVNCKLKDLNNAILLSGHVDTVKESNGHHPKAKIVDEYVEGLGTSDMKSFFASILTQIDDFKSIDTPIILSITSDEETELEGVKKNIEELKKRNINVSFAVIGEPTNLDYYASSRGNSIYVSVMKGIASHSSTPEAGVNAIELESDFINEIKKVSKEHPKASICITSINGGNVPSNVVPDNCSICFGIRTSGSKELNEITSYLDKKHHEISRDFKDSSLFPVLVFPPFERRENYFTNYALEHGIPVVDAKYSTEAGYFQQAFPNADMIIYGPGDPKGIHKAGEAIPGSNLLRYQNEFMELLNNYLEYKKQGVIEQKKFVYKSDK